MKPLSESNPTLWARIPPSQRLEEPASPDLRAAYTVRADLVQETTVDIAEHERKLKAQEALFSVADMHYREQLAEVERLKKELKDTTIKYVQACENIDLHHTMGVVEGERRALQKLWLGVSALDTFTHKGESYVKASELRIICEELGLDKEEPR